MCFFFEYVFNFRTIASLDYETFSEFLFQVHVRDSGQPPRSADSPADVVIKVSKLLMNQLHKLFLTHFDSYVTFVDIHF